MTDEKHDSLDPLWKNKCPFVWRYFYSWSVFVTIDSLWNKM